MQFIRLVWKLLLSRKQSKHMLEFSRVGTPNGYLCSRPVHCWAMACSANTELICSACKGCAAIHPATLPLLKRFVGGTCLRDVNCLPAVPHVSEGQNAFFAYGIGKTFAVVDLGTACSPCFSRTDHLADFVVIATFCNFRRLKALTSYFLAVQRRQKIFGRLLAPDI